MCTVGYDVHIVSTGLPHYGLHYTDSIAGLTFHDKCIFQLTHSRSTTLRFRHKNSHTYGSKPWELQVKSMALWGRKPQGYEMPEKSLYFVGYSNGTEISFGRDNILRKMS